MVWRSARGKRIAYQAAALGGAVLVAWFLISNTMTNLEERRIASGFGFLGREAGFEIGESAFLRLRRLRQLPARCSWGSPTPWRWPPSAWCSPRPRHGGGSCPPVAQFPAENAERRGLRRVGAQRSLPRAALLLVRGDHGGHAARARRSPLPGVFLSNRGIFFHARACRNCRDSISPAARRSRRSSRRSSSGSRSTPRVSSPRSCAPGSRRGPRAGRGSACARLVAPHTTRLVVLPQALRVIVPPMTSQYLNLTKNSSLAVAIGYPEPGVDRQHHHEPDRAGDRGHRDHHGGVPHHQPFDLGLHELVQRQDCFAMRWARQNLFVHG